MKTLALSLAVGAAALLGASTVNAAPAQKQAQAPIASHSGAAVNDTDMSSRHWRRWHRPYWGMHRWHRHPHWAWRRWHHPHRWGYYRPFHRSYAYYPGPIYRPAPVVSFGFGPGWGGGWHRRHWW